MRGVEFDAEGLVGARGEGGAALGELASDGGELLSEVFVALVLALRVKHGLLPQVALALVLERAVELASHGGEFEAQTVALVASVSRL